MPQFFGPIRTSLFSIHFYGHNVARTTTECNDYYFSNWSSATLWQCLSCIGMEKNWKKQKTILQFMDWRQHNCDGEEQCLSLNYLLFDFSNILRIVKIISCRRNKELNIDMSVHFLFISQKCTFASKRIECCLYMHYAIWRINSRFFGSNCYWLSETYYWHFDDMKLRKINSNRRISDNFRSIQTIHLILMPNGNTVETIDRVSYQFFHLFDSNFYLNNFDR